MAEPFHYDITNSRMFNRPLTARVKFPYLAISELARAFKDFIHFKVYHDFKGFVYAEYNKGIQTVMQMMEQKEGELIDYGLPIFNYDINLDTVVPEGNSYWRNSMLNSSTARVLYEPFYSDEEIDLRVVYRRMKGSIPLNIYCSSQPEQIDIQMAFTDAFQGLNRWIVTPIRTFTAIPENFLFTSLDGILISKSLDSKFVRRQFIKAVNRNCYFLNSNSAPLIRLTNLSTSNSLYGGKSNPEFNMTGTCEFEIEMPQYIMAYTKKFSGINEIELGMNFQFNENESANILNNIFGEVLYDQPHENEKAFSKGILIGSNALILDNDTNIILFKNLYPDSNFLPTEKELEIYFDTPFGVVSPFSNYYTVSVDDQGNFQFVFLNGMRFQKGDLISSYVFKPYTQYDEE